MEIKVWLNEGGRRILLGDITGGGTLKLPLTVFQFLGILDFQ
jgi:hypothetical protein